jgi:hypothetical protein
MAMVATACCPAPALKPVVDPPRLGELPTINRTELQCLSAETYDRLLARELIIRATLADCQAIVETMTEN